MGCGRLLRRGYGRRKRSFDSLHRRYDSRRVYLVRRYISTRHRCRRGVRWTRQSLLLLEGRIIGFHMISLSRGFLQCLDGGVEVGWPDRGPDMQWYILLKVETYLYDLRRWQEAQVGALPLQVTLSVDI